MQNYSVLMSVYYKETPAFLETAIQSMLDQTVATNDFVLVCDGELTPQLYGVVDSFKNKYPSIFNIIQLEKNQGLGNALRVGLQECKNELVARMDSDDISASDRAEKQLQAFSDNTQLSLVGGQISEFTGDPGNITGYRVVPHSNDDIYKFMQRRNAVNHVTVMFRKTAVLKAGNYQDFSFYEDYYLWARMCKHKMMFQNLPDILVNVRGGEEMFKRRGGKKYFGSSYRFQRFLLEEKLIDKKIFIRNTTERFIVQVLMPNKLRGIAMSLFTRGKRI